MNALQNINNLKVAPMEIYRDANIRGLKQNPVFQQAMNQATQNQESEKSNPRRLMQLKKLKKASNELVSFLFNDMLKQMRKSVPKDSMMDGGMAEEIFQEMVDQEYSKAWVNNGNIDLANQIYDQLSKHVF